MKSETSWHHAPVHRFETGNHYMVTAATLHQEHFFRSWESLRQLESTLLQTTTELGWILDEWAVFSNHYHWVGWSEPHSMALAPLIKRIHSITARELNRLERHSGRRIWYQYWDKCLTFEPSYCARLNYVHHNPVHHGLVNRPEDYPFCSAARLKTEGLRPHQRQMKSYRYEKIRVMDDFEPLGVR